MLQKKELQRFIDIVNNYGKYYIHDASFNNHFEKWIMLPPLGRRFRMNAEQYDFFISCSTAKFLGLCSYAQGIGLDKI